MCTHKHLAPALAVVLAAAAVQSACAASGGLGEPTGARPTLTPIAWLPRAPAEVDWRLQRLAAAARVGKSWVPEVYMLIPGTGETDITVEAYPDAVEEAAEAIATHGGTVLTRYRQFLRV